MIVFAIPEIGDNASARTMEPSPRTNSFSVLGRTIRHFSAAGKDPLFFF
jgi:hypothetical protein